MAEPIINIINPLSFIDQTILPEDSSLITNQIVNSPFDLAKDQVELYWYDYNKNLIVTEYNYLGWKSYNDPLLISKNKLEDLYVDPAIDGTVAEVTNGTVYLVYNFVSNKLSSSVNQLFYIDQISSDRTEISLKTNNLNNSQLEEQVNLLSLELQNSNYFQEFYLNFGDNNILVGVNLRVGKNNLVFTLDIKLYEPLPSNLNLKDTCWIQTRIADPIAYSVDYNTSFELIDETIKLKGPNYNLSSNNETSNATTFENLFSLKHSNLTSSRSQIDYILNQKGVSLNIDYTDFNNFVHFSSAQNRLANFKDKVSLIQSYENSINQITASTTVETKTTSIATLQNGINDLITNFDGYEYYLYYSSGSKSWPKLNNSSPYLLATVNSTAALNWYGNSIENELYYGGESLSASRYDNENQNNLIYTIPKYIVDNDENLPYLTFVQMVGQHFDTLFTYTDAISQKYNADNRLDYGISKDLLADTLRSFGIKVYENNFTPSDLYSAFVGLTPSGSNILIPNISTIFPVGEQGYEFIQTIISGSNSSLTLDDLNKSIYKRLYHNLPLLIKKKGTLKGLKLLTTLYGIPDTILRISEFGGKDKLSETWDQWQNTFNYSYKTDGLGLSYISSSFQLNPSWQASSDRPQAVEFRFKTTGLPNTSSYSQSLWSTDNGSTLILRYSGSGLTSGSFSGSVINPYYEYGYLEFYPSSSVNNVTASIYLPFFDGNWWSVLINKNSNTNYSLLSKNKIYDGNTGNILGFQASSSVTIANPWSSANISYLGTSSFNSKPFSGSLQELRFYSHPITEETFDSFVMNPNSIEESKNLVFRASLGGELYTGSNSIHPKVAGEQITTSSFVTGNLFFIPTSTTFQPNLETFFYNQTATGIKNVVNNKISNSSDNSFEETLSNQISIQQNNTASTHTPGINYLEVGFSPQNEINEDINSQFGYFNIGDYIGDPRTFVNDELKYTELNNFSIDYFKKYTSSYNYVDYFRLIKFFDNSLFKLIKDFIPARTAAATGAIVKQHLLERNRQRPAQITYSEHQYTASVTSPARDYQTGYIGVFTGGAGGSVNDLTNIPQSWSSSILTKAGIVTEIESSQYEFFNGEYSGSNIDVINNKLQDNPLLGDAYRVGIPDLQNLTATRTTTFTVGCIELVGGSFKTSTSSVVFPFNQSTLTSTYYNTSTYSYTPLYPVQVDIQVSISASFLQANDADAEAFSVDLYLVETSQGVRNVLGIQSFNTGSDAGPFPATNPFNFNKTFSNVYIRSGSTYTIEYVGGCNASADDVGSFQFLVSGTSWMITVDNLAAQSTYYLDPTVYNQQNFPGNINEFSDYNSLLNNVYSNRVSNLYYDVDYNGNALQPTNFSTIVSQSALYAQVQDSNYQSGSSWSKIRYEGTKNTGDYNTSINFSSESVADNYPIDKFSNYFARFSYLTGSNPEYPGGGLFKLAELIGIDGTRISLTGDNRYISFVSEIFKAGKVVTPYGLGTNAVTPETSLRVIEGGGLYKSIVLASGSASTFILSSTTSYLNQGFTLSFTGSSGLILNDSKSIAENSTSWIYSFSNQSSSAGIIDHFYFAGYEYVSMFNKNNNSIVSSATTPNTIRYQDTFLPLRYGDFIRFGTLGSFSFGNTGSLDGSFSGLGLFNILSLNTGSNNNVSSSITLASTTLNNPGIDNLLNNPIQQNFRIFRRIPDETFVVVSSFAEVNINPLLGGLLIPEDFNPEYDPIEVARKAGIEL